MRLTCRRTLTNLAFLKSTAANAHNFQTRETDQTTLKY
jgi:hypothetical protein